MVLFGRTNCCSAAAALPQQLQWLQRDTLTALLDYHLLRCCRYSAWVVLYSKKRCMLAYLTGSMCSLPGATQALNRIIASRQQLPTASARLCLGGSANIEKKCMKK